MQINEVASSAAQCAAEQNAVDIGSLSQVHLLNHSLVIWGNMFCLIRRKHRRWCHDFSATWLRARKLKNDRLQKFADWKQWYVLYLSISGWISHFQANSQKTEIHNLRKHQSKVCTYLRKSIIVVVVQIQAFNETGVDASMARVLADGQKSEELHRSCNELKVMIDVGRQYLIVVCRRSWRTKLKNSIHKLQCSSMSRRRLNPTRRG